MGKLGYVCDLNDEFVFCLFFGRMIKALAVFGGKVGGVDDVVGWASV